MILNFFFILFISSSICLVWYYIFLFSTLLFHKDENSLTKTNIPISIIICAKNEANHLKQNIEKIIHQQYITFEIILVNDHSTDDTLTIMNQLKLDNSSTDIHVISLTEGSSNKKNALSIGINSAKYLNLLLTDADCIVSSKKWISSMTKSFPKKDIILGYGAYEKRNSFLNKLIRFETLLTAIQYFSYSIKGMNYMAVGRNLAYKKKIFIHNNGFKSHKHITSGDDDLFIQEVSTKLNTTICLDKHSFTISKAPKTFKKWMKQKQRHITTSNHYKPLHQLLLGLFYFSSFTFWITFIFLLSQNYSLNTLLYIFISKTIIQYFIYGKIATKLNEKDLILSIPILELFLICFQLYIFGKNCIKKPTNW